jgi:methylphosphotriester-DNA--protein-cysteine methyltransferase
LEEVKEEKKEDEEGLTDCLRCLSLKTMIRKEKQKVCRVCGLIKKDGEVGELRPPPE